MPAAIPRKRNRKVYPLEITSLDALLVKAQKATGIKSKAVLMRMAIERGLPVLIAQLASDAGVKRAA